MSVIDVVKLLNEISPDSPSGGDLEYDPAFVELVRISQGKPEQQMGDSIVPAEEPNWRDVKKKSLALLGRSKDLRLGVYLARSLVNTDGFPGLSDALSVLHGLVDRHWPTVHPALDPDDGNDPTMRVNTLVSLCHPDTMLRSVRETPMVSSKGYGRVSLRDVLIASGKLPAPAAGGSPPPAPAAIDGAFMEGELEALQATAEAVGQSIEHVGRIEGTLTEKVGSAQAADFSPLTNLLKTVQRTMQEQLARRGVGVAPPAEEETGAVGTAAGARAVPGEINTPQDAIRVLDKVCDYFARNEPSSPVPLLLRRAQKLVSKSFVEIVQDLAPDGLSQVNVIRGSSGEES